jgi:putative transposase
VHFLRNALDYVPRKLDDDCLRELRWLYDRRDVTEARRDLAAWLARWQATYPKLCGWVEEHIEDTLSFYRLPRQHHKHLKSTDEIDKGLLSPCRCLNAGATWGLGGCGASAARRAPLSSAGEARRATRRRRARRLLAGLGCHLPTRCW